MLLEAVAFILAVISVVTSFLLQRIKQEDRAHGHIEPDYMYTVKGIIREMRRERKENKKIKKHENDYKRRKK